MPRRPHGDRGDRREGGRRDGDRRNDPLREELSPLGKLVSLIAKALVDQPDQVVVRETDSEHPYIELAVSSSDIGKVIGKDGRTAQSIRALLTAAASRAGKRAQLDIVD